jgi:hypothetical protein
VTEPSVASRAELYAARAVRYGARADLLGRRARWLSHARVVLFMTGLVAALAAFWGRSHGLPALVAGLAGVGFLASVILQGRVLRAEDDVRRHVRVNRDAEARASGRWRDLGEQGSAYLDPDHPFASDLDLFGPASLFQRLSVAHTHFGQDALARLLTRSDTLPEIVERQAAVRGLAAELEFRQRLEALSLEAVDPTGRPPLDPEPVLAWAESRSELTPRRWLVWVARLVPPCAGAALVAYFALDTSAVFWAVPVILQVLALWTARETTNRVFSVLSGSYPALGRFGQMLGLVEAQAFTAELTRSLAAELGRADASASRALADLGRRLSWFEARHNGLVYPFLNVLFCWDIHATLALEVWQRRSGSKARAWLGVLGEFEALSSLAGLLHDEPSFVFPEVVASPATFVAQGLGHPLLDADRRVTNDVRLPGPGTALLVTGSNMGGKSTLLRSIGVASVLTLAGAPVCAKRLLISPLAVRTCLNVRDSLQQNESHFYAEVRRLRGVLEAATRGLPMLFLLDEILHGTNARERGIGARWLLEELLRRGALGAVTTHDLDLTDLPAQLTGRVELVHFREDVTDGRMTFDYRLRPGSVTSGNALLLMRLLGLDVPLE